MLGLHSGLAKFNKKTGNFINNPMYDIRSITNDNNSNIWVGTFSSGLFLYDQQANKLKRYTQTRYSEILDILKISKLYCDLENNLWIGTWNNGLFFYSVSKDSLYHFLSEPDNLNTLSGNMIRAVYGDSQGIIYIGTKSDGLNKYNPITNNFTRIGKNQGLPGNTIYSIESDFKDNLWMGTHSGLIKYVPSENKFIHFGEIYGLQGKIFEINAHCLSDKGLMYFGGSNGLNIFSPEKTIKNNYVAPLIISSFKLFNHEIATDITQSREFVLNQGYNYITISFSLLDYSAPNKNVYEYKLFNFDDNWIESGNRNVATYTSLKPGKYKFTVRAANIDNVWNREGVSLNIIIPKPLYLRWWFITISLLLLFSFIFLGYYYRIKLVRQNEKRLENIVHQKTSDLSAAYETLEKKNKELVTNQDIINKKNEELEQNRKNLEKTVFERTKALMQAKQKAEESDRLKSAFLANMSHEIRTPLNAIVGFAEILASKGYEDDELESINNVIAVSSSSLLQIVNDIIDISKIESNQLEIIKKPFGLSEIMHQVANEFLLDLSKHEEKTQIQFIFNPDNNVKNLIVISDVIRLEQIIRYLLSNALKYTSTGSIELGCKLVNQQNIQIYVKDTGIGISKENLNIIFERFRKVEDDKTRLYRGTGLGLAISHHLVKRLGGNIFAESELKKGTTFYFELPVGKDAEVDSDEIAPKKKNGVPYWKNKHILVVEDEESNYKIIQSILKKTGAQVHRLTDGLSAVQLIESDEGHKFDLILMDIKLPIMNGIDATYKIKELNRELPVIAQTAYAMNNERIEIMKAGFDDYISKPILPQKLIDKIKLFLD